MPVPKIVKMEPRAIAPPGASGGMKLAALTIPRKKISGSACKRAGKQCDSTDKLKQENRVKFPVGIWHKGGVKISGRDLFVPRVYWEYSPATTLKPVLDFEFVISSWPENVSIS